MSKNILEDFFSKLPESFQTTLRNTGEKVRQKVIEVATKYAEEQEKLRREKELAEEGTYKQGEIIAALRGNDELHSLYRVELGFDDGLVACMGGYILALENLERAGYVKKLDYKIFN